MIFYIHDEDGDSVFEMDDEGLEWLEAGLHQLQGPRRERGLLAGTE